MPNYKEIFQSSLSGFAREGIPEFLKWLETTDFYTAPCSTRYHLSREGGLVEHSLNVYECLQSNVARLGLDICQETMAIVALGHDICKADFYTVDYRNAKDENGVWQKVPYYTVKDKFPLGHGEKSIYILQAFMKLSRAECLAIRWHMGGFTEGGFPVQQAMSEAAKVSPLVTLLQIADLEATYLKEGDK